MEAALWIDAGSWTPALRAEAPVGCSAVGGSVDLVVIAMAHLASQHGGEERADENGHAGDDSAHGGSVVGNGDSGQLDPVKHVVLRAEDHADDDGENGDEQADHPDGQALLG